MFLPDKFNTPSAVDIHQILILTYNVAQKTKPLIKIYPSNDIRD